MKRLFVLLLAFLMLSASCLAESAQPSRTLDRVVVLSRHNIRSPLSGGGSVIGEITPHTWFAWTSRPSELSLRGGMAETLMGQYFRLWLEKEGLFPENCQPKENEVRIYANAKQRTIATARFFSAGLFPAANVPVETNSPYDTMDPVFSPVLHFVTEEYDRDVQAQVAEMGGIAGMKGIHAGLMDAISLLMDVTDMEESPAYQAGTYGNLLEDENTLILEADKEPRINGPIRTATSVADALTLQYYEEADAEKAAFGHTLSLEDWQKIHSIVDTYSEMLFATPLVALNAAYPLLKELRSELTAEGRSFSFLCGHDSNLASVLASLNAEEYLLPDTVEQHTPIGAKLVLERWLTEDQEAYYAVSLLYQSTEQLRSGTILSLEEPPQKYALRFSGVPMTEDGLIAEQDLLALFDQAIQAYEDMLEKYMPEEAAENAA